MTRFSSLRPPRPKARVEFGQQARRAWHWLWLLFLALPGPAWAIQQDPQAATAYQVEFLGEMEPGVKEVLASVSDTLALRDRPPATLEMLEKRARSDIPGMIRALRSEGFYDGRVDAYVDRKADPPVVRFEVDTGPPYLLSAVLIDCAGGVVDPSFTPPDAGTLNLQLDTRARAPVIEQGAARLTNHLREYGHPFPRIKLLEAVVDHSMRTMIAHFTCDPGPPAFFGRVKISGHQRVLEEYIHEKLPWNEGQQYQASLIGKLRRNLGQDGLFTLVEVEHPEFVEPDGSLPVHIFVVERNPRTVKAGLSYETDLGLGSVLDWEHRNLRGRGERLRLGLQVAEKQQHLFSGYRIPSFLSEKQSLELSGYIGGEKTETFETTGAGAGVKIFRQLHPDWTAGLGLNYRLSRTTQLGETQTFGLLSIPGELAWDRRNDLLDPTRGWQILLKAEPFADTLDMNVSFFKIYGGVSAYAPLMSDDRLVLAARGGLGSIVGEANRNIPADQRFYAGGGGSIRGYAYQSIGPEENGVVIGGRSIIESSLELRMRMRNNFGLTAFLDGGQVFTDSSLQFKNEFSWGAGLGFRYYTDFAPIRLDVAFPLNKRDRDDIFQIYVSIGQAF